MRENLTLMRVTVPYQGGKVVYLDEATWLSYINLVTEPHCHVAMTADLLRRRESDRGKQLPTKPKPLVAHQAMQEDLGWTALLRLHPTGTHLLGHLRQDLSLALHRCVDQVGGVSPNVQP